MKKQQRFWWATLANHNTMPFQYDPPLILENGRMIAQAVHNDAIPIKQAERNAQLMASAPLLLASLSRYGRHDDTCPLNESPNLPGDNRCTCGFSDILAKVESL